MMVLSDTKVIGRGGSVFFFFLAMRSFLLVRIQLSRDPYQASCLKASFIWPPESLTHYTDTLIEPSFFSVIPYIWPWEGAHSLDSSLDKNSPPLKALPSQNAPF